MTMTERELYERMIEAQYEYFRHIEPVWQSKFANETQHYVLDNTHWAYKYFRPEKTTEMDPATDQMDTKSGSKRLRWLYRKLSVLCHPDKWKHEIAQRVFDILTQAYANADEASLEQFWKQVPKDVSDSTLERWAANVILFDKHNFIQKSMASTWYAWQTNPDALIRQVFIPVAEYEKRLREENARLAEEIAQLETRVSPTKTTLLSTCSSNPPE